MEGVEKITLKSADGEEFKVEKAVAMELGTLRSFLEESTALGKDPAVPLPNVRSGALKAILSYCEDDVELRARSSPPEARKARDSEFVRPIKNHQLRELIVAANYLHVEALLELLIQTAAKRIENRSVEYARRFFGVENDFTPEEERRLREENAWTFENLDPDDDDDDDLDML